MQAGKKRNCIMKGEITSALSACWGLRGGGKLQIPPKAEKELQLFINICMNQYTHPSNSSKTNRHVKKL